MAENKTMDEVAEKALQNIADGTPVEPAPYLVELMTAQHREYQTTVNSHIEFLQGIIAEREAELGTIRYRINELFSGDYMPREEAVLLAVFHPSRKLIEQIKANDKTEEGNS